MKPSRTSNLGIVGLVLLISATWIGFGITRKGISPVEEDRKMPGDKVPAGFGNSRPPRPKEIGLRTPLNSSEKAKALLDLKSGETGILRISPGLPREALVPSNDWSPVTPSAPNDIVLEAMASKNGLLKALELSLEAGGSAKAKVSGLNETSYPADDFTVNIEVKGRNGTIFDFEIEVIHEGRRFSQRLTLYQGSGMVFRLPNDESIMIFSGKDETESSVEDPRDG